MDTTTWIDQVIIRSAVHEDIPSLEWDGEYRHFRRLYQQVYHNVCQGIAVIWIAVDLEVGVIGQLFVQLTSSRKELADGVVCAYMYGFRVRPQFRGFGVGSRLLKAAENDLMQRNFQKITLNVGRQNLDARRFYERHHYRVVAAEPGKWSYIDHLGKRQEVNEPAWRMEKQLVVLKAS